MDVWKCGCMYVYTHILDMYACMYVYIYTHIEYVCIYMCVCTHIYAQLGALLGARPRRGALEVPLQAPGRRGGPSAWATTSTICCKGSSKESHKGTTMRVPLFVRPSRVEGLGFHGLGLKEEGFRLWV